MDTSTECDITPFVGVCVHACMCDQRKATE